MAGAVAFVFPGQGTQRVGMASWIARAEPAAAERFAEASDLLGFDLLERCRRGPDAVLRDTRNAQPAVFVTGCVYAEAAARRGLTPAAAAGHSVGELAALVTVGSLSFAEGVRLVKARADAMADAGGAMAAISGLRLDAVQACVDRASAPGGVLVVSLVNGSEDIVVSGTPDAVEACVAEAVREAGCRKATRLHVSGAFHSPLMAPAVDVWSHAVADATIRDPDLPVVLNATGATASDAGTVRRALVAQLTTTVDWVACVAALRAVGVTWAVECGDSKVLRTLNQRLGLDTSVIRSVRDLDALPRAAAEPAGVAR